MGTVRAMTIAETREALKPRIEEALTELMRNDLAMTLGLSWVEDSTIEAAADAGILTLMEKEPGPLLYERPV